MSIIFPRPTIAVGECIAVEAMTVARVRTGKPILDRRPEVRVDNKPWKAPRLSYHLNCSPIPRTPPRPYGQVLHSCDNEWCINPEHLRIGSQSENIQEMHQRNNAGWRSAMLGENNPMFGRRHSPETIARLSAAIKGDKNPMKRPELRAKVSETLRKRHQIKPRP